MTALTTPKFIRFIELQICNILKYTDPIKLDNYSKLPFCKYCIIKLEDFHDIESIGMFENKDNRIWDRCQNVFDIDSIMTHTGRCSYDCTLPHMHQNHTPNNSKFEDIVRI